MPNDSFTPVSSLDVSDPGDATIRNFQYQAAYGIILLVAASIGRKDYRAIWCEQREDFLGEVDARTFDAFQIKTRQPEQGPWKVNDEPFWKSVLRFVEHDLAFPDYFRRFGFVSNTEFLDSVDPTKAHYCVPGLLRRVELQASWTALSGSELKAFQKLQQCCDVSSDALFAVLKRLDIVRGPERNDFRDVVCQSHISVLPDCSSSSASVLADILESMIARILSASALAVRDGSRHYVALMTDQDHNPYRTSKRLIPADLVLCVRTHRAARFRYLTELGTLPLRKASEDTARLQQKLRKAGLGEQFEILRRQALSAEAQLFDLATRHSSGSDVLSQLENVVLSECMKAKLRFEQTGEPYGAKMLIDVQDRLKALSDQNPEQVYSQHEDMLVGVAALLTGQCSLWWSSRFALEEAL